MSEYFKNFAMMIPQDIARLPSGTPYIATSPEEKKLFMSWCDKNMPSIKELSIEEIQGVFKYWKQKK